jgi:DNA polymerase/3'-5' exonuclease PolX
VKTATPRAEALFVAEYVRDFLAPACERIEIAGSLRRGKPEVGDVELVAVSKSHQVPSGLFFEVDAIAWDLDERLEELVATGILDRLLGKDRYQKLRHHMSGLQVDLFMVKPPASFGCIFLIRTGSADYSHALVTKARDRGFHFREGALHRGALGCSTRPCEIVPTPEEIDVYRVLRLPFVEPERREIAR